MQSDYSFASDVLLLNSWKRNSNASGSICARRWLNDELVGVAVLKLKCSSNSSFSDFPSIEMMNLTISPNDHFLMRLKSFFALCVNSQWY